jgi:hypothetical protein
MSMAISTVAAGTVHGDVIWGCRKTRALLCAGLLCIGTDQ